MLGDIGDFSFCSPIVQSQFCSVSLVKLQYIYIQNNDDPPSANAFYLLVSIVQLGKENQLILSI